MFSENDIDDEVVIWLSVGITGGADMTPTNFDASKLYIGAFTGLTPFADCRCDGGPNMPLQDAIENSIEMFGVDYALYVSVLDKISSNIKKKYGQSKGK